MEMVLGVLGGEWFYVIGWTKHHSTNMFEPAWNHQLVGKSCVFFLDKPAYSVFTTNQVAYWFRFQQTTLLETNIVALENEWLEY